MGRRTNRSSEWATRNRELYGSDGSREPSDGGERRVLIGNGLETRGGRRWSGIVSLTRSSDAPAFVLDEPGT